MVGRLHRMTRTGGLLCALGLVVAASAQPPAAAPLPSSEQILAKYEQFLGGAAALAKVTTRTVISRRIEMGASPRDTILIRYSKAPGLSTMQFRALDGSFIQYINGCDENGGWTTSGPGVVGPPTAGKSSTDGICQQELYYYGYFALSVARMKANIKRLDVKALTRIVPIEPGPAGALAGGKGGDRFAPGPRDAYLVLSVPLRDSDDYAWLYFDVATGALLRRAEAGKGPVPAPPGMNLRFTDFLQYRDLGDGTRAPFQFVSVSPNTVTRGIHTSVIDNQPVADSVFHRPRELGQER